MSVTNNKGISIVMVMVALALVSSGTYFVLQLTKESKVTGSLAKNISLVELEKKRIAAVLADNRTCKLATNFGGVAFGGSTLSRTSLVTGAGDILAATGSSYYDKMLTLDRIEVHTAGGTPGPKNYELILSYLNNTSSSNYSGKKHAVIVIPMYMEIVGGVITNCYARSDGTEVDEIIRASCSPTSIVSSVANVKSVLNLSNTVPVGCTNDITFLDTSIPTNENTTCSGHLLLMGITMTGATSPDIGNSIHVLNVNDPTYTTTSYCGGLQGAVSSSNCAANTYMYKLNSSAATCDQPGDARNVISCSSGDLLWWNSSTSSTCVTVTCSAGQFVNQITSSGAICYQAPPTTCAAGEYVKEFRTSGSDVCATLPVIGSANTCTGSSFGTSITRATTTTDGVLNCTNYNKAKSCSSPSNTTFAYQLTASGANCTQW
jgi:hypothetical protein